VPPTADYFQAVAWAVRNGITNGIGNNLFSPDTVCLRGQIVTFLHRARYIEPSVQEPASWSEAYRELVFAQGFLAGGQEYYSETDYVVSLYDMDRDGIPELKIDNGATGRATRFAHIYTYSEGKVTYLGIGPTDAFYDVNGAPGIFGYYRLSAQEINGTLYAKNGMEIETALMGQYTDWTWPENYSILYGASIEDIMAMGWGASVENSGL